ncbi:hypothetical protein ACWD0D_33715 [Streptomyces griseoincarnatus]
MVAQGRDLLAHKLQLLTLFVKQSVGLPHILGSCRQLLPGLVQLTGDVRGTPLRLRGALLRLILQCLDFTQAGCRFLGTRLGLLSTIFRLFTPHTLTVSALFLLLHPLQEVLDLARQLGIGGLGGVQTPAEGAHNGFEVGHLLLEQGHPVDLPRAGLLGLAPQFMQLSQLKGPHLSTTSTDEVHQCICVFLGCDGVLFGGEEPAELCRIDSERTGHLRLRLVLPRKDCFERQTIGQSFRPRRRILLLRCAHSDPPPEKGSLPLHARVLQKASSLRIRPQR